MLWIGIILLLVLSNGGVGGHSTIIKPSFFARRILPQVRFKIFYIFGMKLRACGSRSYGTKGRFTRNSDFDLAERRCFDVYPLSNASPAYGTFNEAGQFLRNDDDASVRDRGSPIPSD